MKQAWIHNAKTDLAFILSPPFVVLAFVLLFHKQLDTVQSQYSFVTWLFLIVFVDVAHVYSTLFKTYFVKEERQKRRLLYLGIPVLSLVLGIILYQFGDLIFWSALALVAVFHFVRQQYGFMRLYARFESKGFSKTIDNLAIYSATIYPMLYWFCTPRKFNWFVDSEFSWMLDFSSILPYLTWLYFAIIIIWIMKSVFVSIKSKFFNIPKNLLIVGTFLSWYFGIVYFNNDLIFTLLNVISHGIPYIALIYIREIEQKNDTNLKSRLIFKSGFGILLFVLVILGFAFFEELIWENLVWEEHFAWFDATSFEGYYFVLIPLLVVPQLTHYLLDGFIWRRQK